MINQDYLQHDAEILCGAHDGNLVTMDEGHGGQKNEKIKVKFPLIASVPSNHLSDGLVNTGIHCHSCRLSHKIDEILLITL